MVRFVPEKEPQPEKMREVTVRLDFCSDGSVAFMVDRFVIARLLANGCLRMPTSIWDNSVGLQLNGHGQVLIEI